MNWKARALATQELTTAKLMGYITRGKPVPYADAVRLVGMILRAQGVEPEGVTDESRAAEKQKAEKLAEAKKKKAEILEKKKQPEHVQKKVEVQKAKAAPGDYVSSGDMKTPWTEILTQAKTDDRLAMAIEEGVLTPVKAV